jgi:hypothetical protein
MVGVKLFHTDEKLIVAIQNCSAKGPKTHEEIACIANKIHLGLQCRILEMRY